MYKQVSINNSFLSFKEAWIISNDETIIPFDKVRAIGQLVLEEEEMPRESIEPRANREIFMRWKKK